MNDTRSDWYLAGVCGVAVIAFDVWLFTVEGRFDLAIPTNFSQEQAARDVRLARENWDRDDLMEVFQEQADRSSRNLIRLASQMDEMRQLIIQGGLIPVVDARGNYVGDMTKQEARIVLGEDIP